MPDRRLFLKFLGVGLTGAAAGTLGPLAEARGAMPFALDDTVRLSPQGLTFSPITPSSADELLLPPEFGYEILAVWGDRLPGTSARFGYNADFTAFLPSTAAGDEGLLWVNHEYVSFPDPADGEFGVYTQTFPVIFGREATIEDEVADVGASVLHVQRGIDGR